MNDLKGILSKLIMVTTWTWSSAKPPKQYVRSRNRHCSINRNCDLLNVVNPLNQFGIVNHDLTN